MYNSSKITNIEILLPDALCASGEMRQIQAANFGHPSSGYLTSEEVEFPLTKTKAGVNMGDKAKQFPTKWEVYKPNYYRRQISKTQFEFMYRVSQRDGVGEWVDTRRKVNDMNVPFRTYQEAKSHRSAFVAEIMARTPQSVNIPNLHTIAELWEDYEKNRGDDLRPNTLAKHQGIVKNHLVPHFKKKRIEYISIGEVKNYISALRKEKEYETVKGILATMAKIWLYAKELRIISRDTYNEMFVDKDTKIKVPNKTEKKPTSFDAEQVEKLFDYAKSTVYKGLHRVGI